MKIGILHHDLEPSELKIKEYFEEEGFEVFLFDIRHSEIRDFSEIDVVLNRVYASVANRDYSSIQKTLELLKELEKDKLCINSFKTSFYDYNKYEAYKVMKKNNLPTPETILFTNKDDIQISTEKAIKNLGLPLISKRNSGGRGKDITKINTREELIKDLEEKRILAEKEGYAGDFIIQKFIETNRDHDCRLSIINNNFGFSYGRTLVKHKSNSRWLASASKGSVKIDYQAGEEEIKMSLKTSQLLDAHFNTLDIMYTKNGPIIIENNPTPNYFVNEEENIVRIKTVVNTIAEYMKKSEITIE